MTFWDFAGPKAKEILSSAIGKDKLELFLDTQKYNL
jgi:hypothetical protein